jgi:hypothetical protein
MPVEATIALAGKPPVIPELDVNKTFLTLGQLKYLSANALKVEAETGLAREEGARKQTVFQGNTAAGQYLADLGRTPLAPGTPAGAPTGGPPFAAETLRPLQAGESTPAPTAGAPATPPARRPTIWDPEVQAELHRIAPQTAATLIDTHQKLAIADLVGQQQHYEHSARGLALVHDQPSYDAWSLAFAATNPEAAARLPKDWTPELGPQLLKNAQSLDTTFAQKIAEAKSVNEGITAKSGAITAGAEAAKLGPLTTQSQAALEMARAEAAKLGPEAVKAQAALEAAQAQLMEAKTRRSENVYTPTTQGLPPAQPKYGPPRADQAQPGGGGANVTTLPQAEQREAMKNAFYTSQPVVKFLNSKTAYDDVRTMDQKKTGAGDIVGITGFNKLIDPTVSVQPSQVSEIKNLGTFSERAQREFARFFATGEALSPSVRKEVSDAATQVYHDQAKAHSALVRRERAAAERNGHADVHLIYPDYGRDDRTARQEKRAGTPPAAASPTTPGATQGRVVKPGGVFQATPGEVAAVIARFQAAGEPNPSMTRIHQVIKDARAAGVDLTKGTD